MIVNFFFMIVVMILVQDNSVPRKTESFVLKFKVLTLDVYLNMALKHATTGYAYYLTLSIGKD